MKRYLLFLLVAITALGACKSKKKTGGKDEPMTLESFTALFQPAQLPYKLTPEMLQNSMPDSLALDTANIRQFLTDTLTGSDFPKNEKVRFFPLQQIKGNAVDYILIKASTKSSQMAYLCITDKKGKYLNRLPVGRLGQEEGGKSWFTLDSKFVIKVTDEKQLAPHRTAIKEDFYMANPDGSIMLIMTNTSGAVAPGQIFNPIDTLPRKHKFSADYTSGEMNIVSVRDGDDPKSFLFFITFTKADGCKGELSGTGLFTGPNKGEYRDKESSCGIAFQFSSGRVTIREIGGCGAYRGIKCFFEGGFVKKAEKKKKK